MKLTTILKYLLGILLLPIFIVLLPIIVIVFLIMGAVSEWRERDEKSN